MEKKYKEKHFDADLLIMENEQDRKDSKMCNNLAYNIYAQNNIGVESPAKLIEMLYEGVLRFNAQAKKAIKDKDIEKRTYWINRSVAVITELINTLDMSQGQVSQYLEGLYSYEITLLTSANIKNDADKLDEVSNVFKSLLEAWRETTQVA
jgi:flagellar protein FliS